MTTAHAVSVHAKSHLLVAAQGALAWRAVDRQPFAFTHGLCGHPLFEMPQLMRLAERGVERGARAGTLPAPDRGTGLAALKRRALDDIARLDEGGRWLKISYVNELDPACAALLDHLLRELESLQDAPIRERMSFAGLTVFMNSPGLAVPYHFDHETNFLMQLRGEKVVYLFDPDDRAILSEAEIEDFYRGNPMAGRYREGMESCAACHQLLPGIGVHHPPLAPHMLRNGASTSVSLSLFYSMPRANARARVYQANYCLRRLGLRPRPPGESPARDRAKRWLMDALATPHPRTQEELLFAGMQRLGAPVRLARRLRAG